MSTADRVSHYRDNLGLGQLYTAMQRNQHNKFLRYIIEKQKNIDYQISATDFLQRHRPELIGCTALHLALDQENWEIFNFLLKRRADYNVKNNEGMSVFRCAIEEHFNKREVTRLRRRFKEYREDFTTEEVNGFVMMQRLIEEKKCNDRENWRMWGKIEDKYVDAILSACVEFKNVPVYSDGISLIHAACLTNNAKAFEFLLKNGADVNQTLNSPIFNGMTLLDFVVKYSSAEIFRILLDSEVNLFWKESVCMSAVDVLVDQNLKIIEWLQATNKSPYKNSVLDYVENEEKLKAILNKTFGADSIGFSGFYAACLLTNRSLVQINCLGRSPFTIDEFLKGGHRYFFDRISSSTIFPDYTPLHFAAFFNIDTVKLLISSGADIQARNKYGVTPLDILETRATIDDLHFIVSHKESWKCITLSDGKTKLLDLINSMNNISTFQSFLNEIDINLHVPSDSPLWPGYTILHLVATFSETVKKVDILRNTCNSDKNNLNVKIEKCCREHESNYLERIKLCLEKNADVTIGDARGWTPINLAFRQRNMEAVKLMVQHHVKIINPTDEDNLSHLHIACSTKNHELVEKLLANGADVNAAIKSSFKWRCDYHRCTSTDAFDIIGSTPLHINISANNLNLVKILLKNGADVNSKDASGLTPLHRIFLLRHVWEDGNALFVGPKTSDARASLYVRDFYGDIKTLRNVIRELLSSPNLKESIVDDYGLSHLHIAAYEDDVEVVKKLLDLGSPIDSVIKCSKKLEANHPLFALSRYHEYTPLHMTLNERFSKTEKLLMDRGADYLTTRADGKNHLFARLQDLHWRNCAFFVAELKENKIVRRRLQDEFGWTILHVACQRLDVELARFAFSIGVDVNSQTRKDSPLHPGCTALHVLLTRSSVIGGRDYFEAILSLLLDNDADVTLADVRGDTALHRSDFTSGWLGYDDCLYTNRLLQRVKNLTINPTNHHGISLFHIVCIRHDVDAVSKFLDHGVDVNRPIEFSSNYVFGRTPLQLAVSFPSKSPEDIERQLQTIELLLKRGAEVNAEDTFGDTPLHLVSGCESPRDAVYEILFGHGANIDATNIFGMTPLQSLLDKTSIIGRELEFFLKRGCRLNAFNDVTQVGYLSTLIRHCRETMDNDIWKVALTCPSIHEVDCKGRTAIHNIVSTTDYKHDGLFQYFLDQGCDIDCQDESGMTALHLAAQFRNSYWVEALLSYGCDVNVLDHTGRTAFAYILEPESLCESIDSSIHDHRFVIDSFARFFCHMELYNIYMNDVNKITFRRAFRASKTHLVRVELEDQYRKVGDVEIGKTAFVVNDFFSETKAIVYYSKILPDDRREIEQFFTTTVEEFYQEKYEFQMFGFLCKAQYRKALQRGELVENAKGAINIVIGFPLPDLCYEVLEKFLANADLKSLIAASTM